MHFKSFALGVVTALIGGVLATKIIGYVNPSLIDDATALYKK